MKRFARLSPALALSVFSLVGCAPDENPAGPTVAEETTVPSFATAANTWTVRAPLNTPRAGLKATAVNGIIYAIGGSRAYNSSFRATVEAYDPGTNSWTPRRALPEQLEPTGATTLNNRIYVAGGRGSGGYSTALYVYNPVTNSWTRKAGMPYKGTRLGGHQGAVNGLLYVYLGMTTNPDGTTTGPQRFLRYNPATNTWASLKVPSFARAGGASMVYSGQFYILGGKLPRGGGVTGQASDVHVYNPASNAWSKLPLWLGGYYAVPEHAYATSKGKLYISGSDYSDGSYGVNKVYNPATNTAANFAEPRYARYRAAGAAVNGQFYNIGGYTCDQASSQSPCDPTDLAGVVETYTP